MCNEEMKPRADPHVEQGPRTRPEQTVLDATGYGVVRELRTISEKNSANFVGQRTGTAQPMTAHSPQCDNAAVACASFGRVWNAETGISDLAAAARLAQ